MSQDKVLLIAGDTALGERVSRLLTERGVDCHVVDPATDDVTPEGLFDIAFERQSTAVLLIERLGRHGSEAQEATQEATDALLAATLRAARSPMVTGFGWVTSREAPEALDEFRQKGKPYGVVRPGPLIDLGVGEVVAKGKEAQVLISSDLSERAARDGALSIGRTAREVAAWFENDGHRGGGETLVVKPSQPLEEAVREAGFSPLTLPRWRVGLNRLLGTLVVDDQSHPWTIRRAPFFRSSNRRVTSAARELSGVT